MPHINPNLPNDGESADASDISTPFLALLAVFNGHIGADNIEPGTIVDSIGTGSIVTAKMGDEAVTGPKVADHAITPQKVASPVTVDSTAAVTAITLTPLLSSRMFIGTNLTQSATIAVPTGTPEDGQGLLLRLEDNGTARSLTWNAIYRGIGVTLPTTTSAGKVMYLSMLYNLPDTKWDVVSIGRQG